MAYKDKKILCIETGPGGSHAALFTVSEGRVLSVIRQWEDFTWGKFSEKLGFHPRFLPDVVLAAHPSLVYSVSVPLRLTRSHAEPLGAPELENFLSQTLSRVFNQKRKEASEALSQDELDTILVSTRVSNFKVGDSEVLNPLGIRARHMSSQLHIVFTTRHVFDQWKNFFNGRSGFYFTDCARSCAALLSRYKEEKIFMVAGDGAKTYLYAGRVGEEGFLRTPLQWNVDQVVKPLSRRFGISDDAGLDLIKKFCKQELSLELSREVGSLFSKSTEGVMRELSRRKVRGVAYIRAPFAISGYVVSKRKDITLECPPYLDCITKAGYSMPERSAAAPSRVFELLAYYLEFYYDKSDSIINRWLTRRVHWLIPPGESKTLPPSLV